MTGTLIRPARVADAPRVAAFLKAISYFHRLDTLSLMEVEAQVARHLAQCLADHSHAVYLADNPAGELVGYVSVHWLPYLFLPGPEGYVSELFVAEQARGQGVGTRLLAAVKQEAAARGCWRLSLLNMRGRESYQRAFYAKDGWVEREDAANFVLEVAARP